MSLGSPRLGAAPLAPTIGPVARHWAALGNRGDFVRFLVRRQLPQTDGTIYRPGTHEPQRPQSASTIMTPPKHLAIDGDLIQISVATERSDQCDPILKTLLESDRLECSKETPQGVMRRNAVWQFQVFLKPLLVGLCPGPDCLRAIASSDDRHDANNEQGNVPSAAGPNSSTTTAAGPRPNRRSTANQLTWRFCDPRRPIASPRSWATSGNVASTALSG